MNWNNKDDKIWRKYQVIDEETGEVLPKERRKEYITIKTEKSEYKNQYGQKIEVTTRIVRHNGQTRIEL